VTETQKYSALCSENHGLSNERMAMILRSSGGPSVTAWFFFIESLWKTLISEVRPDVAPPCAGRLIDKLILGTLTTEGRK